MRPSAHAPLPPCLRAGFPGWIPDNFDFVVISGMTRVGRALQYLDTSIPRYFDTALPPRAQAPMPIYQWHLAHSFERSSFRRDGKPPPWGRWHAVHNIIPSKVKGIPSGICTTLDSDAEDASRLWASCRGWHDLQRSHWDLFKLAFSSEAWGTWQPPQSSSAGGCLKVQRLPLLS